ncbi:MAG: DUF455 family protein [Polyangiales bacterium]
MRARVLHGFIHHEVQAAELMAWAISRGPCAARVPPRLADARDEARHVAMYSEHLERLGSRYGDLPVRDWFWQRLPTARTGSLSPRCAGLEGANLDHAARFAQRFAAAGDPEGARRRLVGGRAPPTQPPVVVTALRRGARGHLRALGRASLTPPLTPWVMRATPSTARQRPRAQASPRVRLRAGAGRA